MEATTLAGSVDMEHLKNAGAESQRSSKQGIFWILAGLVAIGVAAGYKWLRDLPRL